MNIKEIKKIIDLIEATNIHEIEIKEGESSIRLVKGGVHAHTHAFATQPVISSLPTTHAEASPEPSIKGHLIRSPMVGTFYAAASPEAPPFVTVGQTIQAGDVLCIIEAMKMFNEIDADKSGKIVDILVKNGDPIEYDQPLFILE